MNPAGQEVRIAGIAVSRVGFGTASLHHLPWGRDRQRLLAEAHALGFTHFDTAPYYGRGLAEHEMGRFVNQSRREAMTITTKFGLYPPHAPVATTLAAWSGTLAGRVIPRLASPVQDWTMARATRSLHRSLRQLRTDYVDFLFLHEPPAALPNADDLLEWLSRMRDRGAIRAWGLAGGADHVAPFVATGSPLAQVVQTRDSLHRREAAFLQEVGRPLQFTYGYLAHLGAPGSGSPPRNILRDVKARNPSGCVLFSSRKPERLRQFAADTA